MPGKTMINAMGQSVPVQYVPKFDRERDRASRRILARFQKAQDYLARVKAETLADIVNLRGEGSAGNFQFQSFDGLIRVRLDARTLTEFDHRFQQAQSLIFEFLDDITKATEQTDIAAIIRAAFKPSAGGLLSRAKILSLTRLDIKNTKWTQAMDLLRASQFAKSGKTYVYCETRPTPGDDFDTILLDFASIDPAADERPGNAQDAPGCAAFTPPGC